MIEIGIGAGGSTDTMGRVFAEVMKEQTGRTVIVENRPGGGGIRPMLFNLKDDPEELIDLG